MTRADTGPKVTGYENALGKRPDVEVGDMFDKRRETVAHDRAKRGIPPFLRFDDAVAWLDQQEEPASDVQVAQAIGVTPSQARKMLASAHHCRRAGDLSDRRDGSAWVSFDSKSEAFRELYGR